jgi:biopolymer transport protein ExbD
MKVEFKKAKEEHPVSDINVTPMVDVMLVLLIIFMVITPMLQHGVQVDMVKTKNPIPMQDADKSDAILIAVTRDGSVFLGNTRMSPEDLPNRVRDLLTNRINKMVFIRSDSRARYEKVVTVVDNLRAAGVDQVGLLTEQVKDKNANPNANPNQNQKGGNPAGQ